MDSKLKVGILRETKNPPDRRVPLTPPQIVALEELYPDVDFYVQPSDARCYSDEEYDYLNIQLKEDLKDCDVLLGVKEIDARTFIPGKTYMFFAHVAKQQPQNREMFREMVKRKVRLIDFEYLTTEQGQRVVAFGRYAGIVGAYNALRARGISTNRFKLKPAYQCHDLEEMWAGLRLIQLAPGLKILVTGKGRVAGGALETLNILNIERVEPRDFITREYNTPVVCQVGPEDYVRNKQGFPFSFGHFVANPGEYASAFEQYTRVTDILITGHFWNPGSPVFFTSAEMRRPDFRISIIADVSCDIKGPIPSTLRASTIADPFYMYNPLTGEEETAFSGSKGVTVMAVDNLPGELPRDASRDFGEQLITNVLHDLFTQADSKMLERATIIRNGELTPTFSYLNDYLRQ